MRTKIRTKDKLPTGKVKIDVETTYVETKPAGPLKVTLKVNGKQMAEGTVPVSAPVGFTANDCLDFGQALGSPVSMDYREKAPFKFNGTIEQCTSNTSNSSLTWRRWSLIAVRSENEHDKTIAEYRKNWMKTNKGTRNSSATKKAQRPF